MQILLVQFHYGEYITKDVFPYLSWEKSQSKGANDSENFSLSSEHFCRKNSRDTLTHTTCPSGGGIDRESIERYPLYMDILAVS